MINKRKINLPLILILFMLTFTVCSNAFASKTALKNYEKGIRAMEKGNYEGAITLFNEAISYEPEDKKMRIGMMYYEYAPNKKLQECKTILAKREKIPIITEDLDGPEIVLTGPSSKKEITLPYTKKDITLRGSVKDTSNIFWVKINETSITVDKNGDFQGVVPVVAGTNKITIEASDALGNLSHYLLTVTREKADINIANLYGSSFAVVIGVDDYEKKWPSLEYSVNSALAVSQKLKKIGFQHVTTLLDKEAIKDRIINELDHKLSRKVDQDDRVLVYFAGNTYTKKRSFIGSRKGYIIPADAPSPDDTDKTISLELIRDITTRIPAKHILIVMDSCFSVPGLKKLSKDSLKVSRDLKENLPLRSKSVQIISAGGEKELAQVANGKGLFTTYFLRAFDGEGDLNKDGIIAGKELGVYLQSAVSKATGQKQTPLFGMLEGEGEFLLTESYNLN